MAGRESMNRKELGSRLTQYLEHRISLGYRQTPKAASLGSMARKHLNLAVNRASEQFSSKQRTSRISRHEALPSMDLTESVETMVAMFNEPAMLAAQLKETRDVELE
jgi:hypothetical protein